VALLVRTNITVCFFSGVAVNLLLCYLILHHSTEELLSTPAYYFKMWSSASSTYASSMPSPSYLLPLPLDCYPTGWVLLHERV